LVSTGLVGHEWSVEEYGRLLEIGGGKERMTAYFLVRDILGMSVILLLRLGWHISSQRLQADS